MVAKVLNCLNASRGDEARRRRKDCNHARLLGTSVLLGVLKKFFDGCNPMRAARTGYRDPRYAGLAALPALTGGVEEKGESRAMSQKFDAVIGRFFAILRARSTIHRWTVWWCAAAAPDRPDRPR